MLLSTNEIGILERYSHFLAGKSKRIEPAGFKAGELNHRLKDWQADLVHWFCRIGRPGCFEDTGLGKTFQYLVWAEEVIRHTGKDVLALCPLAVAQQTKREAEKFGIGVEVRVCRESSDLGRGINLLNYERLHKIDGGAFDAVVLDESGLLKHLASKTRQQLTDTFRDARYKLPCTATPAPNDHVELGNHSEFCGWMNRTDMLATYFVHDSGKTSDWRLRGHAEAEFWKWMASWSVMLRKPSDIGYEDNGYILPPLKFHEHAVASNNTPGYLFATEAKTLADQRAARRETIEERTALLADMANRSSEPWVVWCNLNAESEAAANAIGDAVEVTGSQSIDEKEEKLQAFSTGKARVIVTKPDIAGWGLNWQHASNVAFLGISHSYEGFYQAVRRCWRFGQTRPVNVHIIVSERDACVLDNIHRKEQDHERMIAGMVAAMQDETRANVRPGMIDKTEYRPGRELILPSWLAS